MGLTKKQLMWAGIILLGILAYVLFFRKRAKATPISENLMGSKEEKTSNAGENAPITPISNTSVATQQESNPQVSSENTNQDEEKDVWFKSKFSSADESYVGRQDCVEPCEKRFQFQRLKCFNKLNNGLTFNLPSSADDCIRLAEAQKIACMSKCTNVYPTNKNFNYDVRDNFQAIIGRTLFEQGYI